MKCTLSALFFLISIGSLSAQKIEYAAILIPDSLTQNCNAVVRLDQTDITIASQRSMNAKNTRAVTVYNENGLPAIQAYEYYSKRLSVKNIEAAVYDALGKEIKRVRRKDFRDQTAVGGGTFFSDDRILYLDYTPVQYPFTIVYESEVETSNTAFIPDWRPLHNYNVSIQKSIFNISYPDNLGFKKKESNFTGYAIEKTTDSAIKLSYSATNICAQKREDYSPDYSNIFPRVMFGLENFNLEGIDGHAKSWKDFGQWYSEKILSGTTELSEEAKSKARTLVGSETDPIKKARIIYNYMQQKSRYISIQVGIGGWKPMPAADVDRLGYGDCKALSNYTRALLDAVGVPSFYTILYGNREKKSIDPEFVSMQGNHVILSVPDGKDYIWLECTSQDSPFGYQANFTDDRNVLVIKPEGGEIVRTRTYNDQVNFQKSKGNYLLSEFGELSGAVSIISEGSQYDDKYQIEMMLPTEKEAHYKDYWSNINNLKIKKTAFANDKDSVRFTENLEIGASNYGSLSGTRMLFAINGYNQLPGNVKRIRNRKTPFEIARGSFDEDEIAVALPKGFVVEALPKDFELKGKYGEYKTEIVKIDDSNLIYKRRFFLKKGLYSNNEYEDFRLFIEQISKNDHAKIVLIKNQ